jgi:acyl carrier protein
MISPKLKQVILEELELDDFDLQDSTEASEVPGWDSLSHSMILSSVEEAFGLRFGTMEALRLKSVGDLQALLDRKLNA